MPWIIPYRLTQYFDHYLKGAAAPPMMTMHTLAGYKGKNNLYAVDAGGYCGKDCAVCKERSKEHAGEIAKYFFVRYASVAVLKKNAGQHCPA